MLVPTGAPYARRRAWRGLVAAVVIIGAPSCKGAAEPASVPASPASSATAPAPEAAPLATPARVESPPPAVTPAAVTPDTACSTDGDCVLSPYPIDIMKPGQCGCYACSFVPLNRDAASRRAIQHEAHCTHLAKPLTCAPNRCAATPRIACVQGACRAER